MRLYLISILLLSCLNIMVHILQMKVLERLLQNISPQQIKDYESYVQLHLKQVLTTINKHKLEDTTQPKIRKYQCYLSCYRYFGQEKQQNQNQMLYERLQELRSCKEKCGEELREVQKFLDNINFYSKLKFTRCSKSCTSNNDKQRNFCLWECYNRLDRRYKEYWAEQRVNVEAKHKI